MAGSLAAQFPTLLVQHAQHITVTHRRAQERNTQGAAGMLQAKIGHERADDTAPQSTRPLPVRGNNVEQVVAIHDFTLPVHHDQPVTVAVQRNPEIGFVRQHGLLEKNREGRATMTIDVKTVRLIGDRNNFGAELAEDQRGNVISRTVRAVHDDFEPLEIQTVREGALAKFDVAPAGVVITLGLAERIGSRGRQRLLHHVFDGQLHVIRQLGALRREKLDAIVVVRIVRGGDHDAGAGAGGAREIGDRRRGHRPEQADVHAGGGESRLKQGFQQITGDTRVLADQNLGVFGAALAKDATGGPAELEHRFRRDGFFTHFPADTVGAEISPLVHRSLLPTLINCFHHREHRENCNRQD